MYLFPFPIPPGPPPLAPAPPAAPPQQQRPPSAPDRQQQHLLISEAKLRRKFLDMKP